MQLIPRAIAAPWLYKYRLATNPATVLACAKLWDIKSKATDEDGETGIIITRAPASRQGTLAAFVGAEIAKGRGIRINPGKGITRDAWCFGSPTPTEQAVWSTQRIDDADWDYSDNAEAFVVVEPSAGWTSPGATQPTSASTGTVSAGAGGQISLAEKTLTAPWLYHYRSVAPADAAATLACAARWDVASTIPKEGETFVNVVPAPPGRQGTLASWIAGEASKGNAIYVSPSKGVNRLAWCVGQTLGTGKNVRSTRRIDIIDFPPEEAPEAFVVIEPSAGWVTPTTASQASPTSHYAAMTAPSFNWKEYALPAGLAIGGLVLLGAALSD